MLSAKKIYCTVVDSSIFVAILMFPITVLGESGSIEILERTIGASKQLSGSSVPTGPVVAVDQRLVGVMKSLKIDVLDEKEIKNELTRAIENSHWKIESLSVIRFKVDRGFTTSIQMLVDTGSSCVRNERWIALLGKPWALNLAEPYGYVDISTPENVDKYLNGHVVALHYRLSGENLYSIYSGADSGCFEYLRIN